MFWNIIYSCDGKARLICWFAAQETFIPLIIISIIIIIIINKNSSLVFFVESVIHFS